MENTERTKKHDILGQMLRTFTFNATRITDKIESPNHKSLAGVH